MSMTSRPGSATLKQVAEEAGVSIAAVSKVLHDRGKNIRVSDTRAAEIRAVAQRLQYRPNVLAQSLRTSRTRTVGLIFENFGRIADGAPYYIHLLDGVAFELFAHHYRLTILPDAPALNAASSLNDGRLDGVIWCKMPNRPELWDEFGPGSVPIVGLNAPPPPGDSQHPYVRCDNEGGARLVVDHLAGLGHRRIAYVQEFGEQDTPDAQARLAGFRAAMQWHGLDASDANVLCWDTAVSEMAEWTTRIHRQTALFAWNERMGAEILQSARRLKLSVPEDLSVVGFDSTPFCDTTQPRLTAVSQPIREMAQTATRLLLALIEGREAPRHQALFPCTLDVRDSTGSPSVALSIETQR